VNKQEFLAVIDKYLEYSASFEEEDRLFQYYDSYQLFEEK
jgi:hypothetical protein